MSTRTRLKSFLISYKEKSNNKSMESLEVIKLALCEISHLLSTLILLFLLFQAEFKSYFKTIKELLGYFT